jgi:tetratricopeptide (TPR) repeat protein
MLRTARPWKGAGVLMLGGALLSGASAFGADEPTLSDQLSDLGRQALAQGNGANAKSFFKTALELDPANKKAVRGLADVERADGQLVRVAMQDPPAQEAKPAAPAPEATPPPAANPPAAQPDNKATLEQTEAAENVARQQLTNDVEQRIHVANALLRQGEAEAAQSALRLALNVVRSATNVAEADRAKLERRVQAQLLSTVQAEERIVADRAERTRLDAAAEQRTRTIDLFQRNKETIEAMMIQFDTLVSEGVYNVLYSGGMGDITATTQPFQTARLLAQKAYALQRGGPLPYSDNNPAPGAGKNVAYSMGFLSQALQFRDLERYRALLTLQDVDRAAVPFPDTQTIDYPDAVWWRAISEKRIKRWGHAVSLFENDAKTKLILEKLDEPIPMSFNEETPLEDVLKYVRTATTTANFSGIPIYVDPMGLQEADKTMTSTVRNMDLDGVPLKVTLKMLLRQLDLTYTVKDGFLMITYKESQDQQTEIRVYPVADLVIIPLSLIMGGGGGGMGGGMGGMGGGMGGMGGGMGGMGGGMGGMGGGMGGGGMGGMMSVPVTDFQDSAAPSDAFAQKKSN